MANITSARWWQPNNPDEALPGILLAEDDRGWVLRLDGRFRDGVRADDVENIGKPVALTWAEADVAFVPTAEPAHAPALDAVAQGHRLEEAEEFGLDQHSLHVQDIHCSFGHDSQYPVEKDN